MPHKQRRHSVKSKQAKQILKEVSEKLKVNAESLFGPKPNVEIVESDVGNIYLVNEKPLFFNKLQLGSLNIQNIKKLSSCNSWKKIKLLKYYIKIKINI